MKKKESKAKDGDCIAVKPTYHIDSILKEEPVPRERAFAVQKAQVVDSPTEESKRPSLGLNWWATHTKGQSKYTAYSNPLEMVYKQDLPMKSVRKGPSVLIDNVDRRQKKSIITAWDILAKVNVMTCA